MFKEYEKGLLNLMEDFQEKKNERILLCLMDCEGFKNCPEDSSHHDKNNP